MLTQLFRCSGWKAIKIRKNRAGSFRELLRETYSINRRLELKQNRKISCTHRVIPLNAYSQNFWALRRFVIVSRSTPFRLPQQLFQLGMSHNSKWLKTRCFVQSCIARPKIRSWQSYLTYFVRQATSRHEIVLCQFMSLDKHYVNGFMLFLKSSLTSLWGI